MMVAVLLQRPVDWVLVLGACGFALFTLAWVGMYFRLKGEAPVFQRMGVGPHER